MAPAEAAWPGRRFTAFGCYVLASAALNTVWEVAQLPLYTLWNTTFRTIFIALLHCTAGDVVIAVSALAAAVLLTRSWNWPFVGRLRVAITAVAIGVAYTLYSEHVNTAIRGTWTYSDLMPVVPWLGIGLSPLVQWIVVPSLALAAAARGGAARRCETDKRLSASRGSRAIGGTHLDGRP